MNLSELFFFREVRWFEDIPIVSFLTALVVVGFIAIAVAGGAGSFLEGAGLIAGSISVAVGIVGGGSLAVRYENQRKEAIGARLAQLATPQLVALSGSPEVSEWNRNLVTEFLNKHRRGWSFDIDTINTTAC